MPAAEIPPSPPVASAPDTKSERTPDPGKRPAGRRNSVRSAATTGLFLLVLLAALHFGRDFLLPIALAVTISLMLRPLVHGLSRCHIPEGIGAGIIVLGAVGLLATAAVTIYEPAMDWAERAPQTLSKVHDKARELQRRVEDVGRAAAEVEKLANPNPDRVPLVQIKGEDMQTTLARYTADATASTVIALVMLYFLLATRTRFLHKALELLVEPAERASKASIVSDTERSVSRYLFTIATINLGLGVAVGAAMWGWGVPNALLWGVMAAALNFVPYLGAVAGVAITALVAIVTFNDLRWAAVPLTYLLLTSIEGMLITPAILGRRFALDPVVVFVWLVFWGWLWGIGGALLAMPMLVMLRIISDRSPALDTVVRLISNQDALRSRSRRAGSS